MDVCAWQHFRYGLKWCSLMTRYMIARWVTRPQGNDNYTRGQSMLVSLCSSRDNFFFSRSFIFVPTIVIVLIFFFFFFFKIMHMRNAKDRIIEEKCIMENGYYLRTPSFYKIIILFFFCFEVWEWLYMKNVRNRIIGRKCVWKMDII